MTTAAIPEAPPVTPAEPEGAPKKARKPLGWKALFVPNANVPGGLYTVALGVWALVVAFGWVVAPGIIPTPTKVFSALVTLVTQKGLLGDMWVSLRLNLEALTLSTLAGLAISYIGGTVKMFKPLAEGIAKFRFLSMAGFSYVYTVTLGGGHPLKLALLTQMLLCFFVAAMLDVVQQVPDAQLDYARTLRMGPWRTVWESQVLGTLGSAFDILRQNAAMGWAVLVAVEALARSEGGMGSQMLSQEKFLSLGGIFAMQLVFLLVGIVQDFAIRGLRSWTVPSADLAYNNGGR